MEFPTNAVLLALSFIGVGSLAYLLFCKDNDDDLSSIGSQKCIETEVRVPKDCVGIVIGRQGSNLKELEEVSGVKINFSDKHSDADYRICRIRGTPEATHLAEASIHAIIANQPLIETFEFTIPGESCGRVIGKNGETIRNICFNSNAKITISREPLVGNLRNVIIKGTSNQIATARSLLAEKVAEEREYQSRMEQSVGSRSPRHAPKFLLSGPANNETSHIPAREKLLPTGSDGLLEVYASAIESPDRLWLQVKGPSTVELDRLNDRMTDYYAKPESREIHALSEVRVGQLVAAPFMYDNKHYRAQVCGVTEIDSGHELDLYYVDYGDSGICLQTHAFDLRTDYLKLRFQAIEVILARVQPKDDMWSEEATDLLEELTYVALWKPLTARIHSYKDRPTRAKREGSPVPCVDLYDTNGPNEINVANELVTRGFAEWVKEAVNGDSSISQSLKLTEGSCDDSEDEAVELKED